MCQQQICLSNATNMPHMPIGSSAHETTMKVYITYRLHITAYISKKGKPICFGLSSHMHMYYAFGNYIFSLSSITTYAFLVSQTYFVFCFHANNIGHMFIIPMKC